MTFGSSYTTIWLWLVPAVVIFYSVAGRAGKNAIKRFAGNNLLPELSGAFDAGKRKLKISLITVAVMFIALSLTRPQWGFEWKEVKRQGIDILIGLDTSNSMLAEDVLPNRLRRAKLAIKDLVKKLQGDRVGLVAFSGNAFLQCPLTVDYDGFILSLDDIDADTIPVGGTSLARVIYAAVSSYKGSESKNKVLVLITDGEDLEGGVDKAVKKAKDAGIQIYCVGIGSKDGELVPLTDENGKRYFLKDAQDTIVKTRLVEGPLQRMAIETGGIYVRATGAEFGLSFIYDEKLSKLEKQELKSKMEKRYHERFQIPLAIALILLLLEPLIGDRKNEGR